MKTLKYFVWNAIIFCTLLAGYLLDCMNGTGMAVGIFYGAILIPCYGFMVLFSETKSVKEALKKSKMKFEYSLFFEPLWPILAIYMGYHKIGIAMIAETLMTIYILIVAYLAKKEQIESEAKND